MPSSFQRLMFVNVFSRTLRPAWSQYYEAVQRATSVIAARILSRLAANAASNLSMFATCPTTDHDNITQGTVRERICCKRTGKAPPRYRHLADRLIMRGVEGRSTDRRPSTTRHLSGIPIGDFAGVPSIEPVYHL
jgi:hypothetical protein